MKYNNSFACYGQSVAGRINYHQKMGVAGGIIEMLKREMYNRGLRLEDWQETITVGSETGNKQFKYTQTKVTMVIPTQDHDWLEGKCPTFNYQGKIGLIDMLHFNSELQFHIMLYDRESKTYKNGHWHTVRECLTLEQTCTLFEYVEDVIRDLIVLSLAENEKYNSTGALGVSK